VLDPNLKISGNLKITFPTSERSDETKASPPRGEDYGYASMR
jgi:hypothetical protein